MTGQDWPDDAIARLRTLWDAGISATEIGRRMGRSKNSVVGKVHRLHLVGRPSPIPFSSSTRPRPVRRVTVVSLPPLLALLDDPILLTTPPRERPAPKPVVEVPRVMRESNRQCEWLFGDKPFKRCTNKAVFGYSYCEECCRRGYINWRGAVAEVMA